MNKLMEQAQQMQAQVEKTQEEAVKEVEESSVGGGLVKVTANGAGAVLSIEISPEAIDPADPEVLGDLVLAGVNEALRSAAAKVEAKAQQMQSELLGGLGLPGLALSLDADLAKRSITAPVSRRVGVLAVTGAHEPVCATTADATETDRSFRRSHWTFERLLVT